MSYTRIRTITRCLRCVALLLAAGRRGLTVEELRSELGCSRATLYRDIADLRNAGVELEQAELPGMHAVYRVTKPFQVHPMGDFIPRRGGRPRPAKLRRRKGPALRR
jgi:predicted DNA-binding transcriptional regulator YafY